MKKAIFILCLILLTMPVFADETKTFIRSTETTLSTLIFSPKEIDLGLKAIEPIGKYRIVLDSASDNSAVFNIVNDNGKEKCINFDSKEIIINSGDSSLCEFKIPPMGEGESYEATIKVESISEERFLFLFPYHSVKVSVEWFEINPGQREIEKQQEEPQPFETIPLEPELLEKPLTRTVKFQWSNPKDEIHSVENYQELLNSIRIFDSHGKEFSKDNVEIKLINGEAFNIFQNIILNQTYEIVFNYDEPKTVRVQFALNDVVETQKINEDYDITLGTCTSKQIICNELQKKAAFKFDMPPIPSPAAQFCELFWEKGLEKQIDPAFVLATYHAESNFGRNGVAKETKSIGNEEYRNSDATLPCPGTLHSDERHCSFKSFEDSISHTYNVLEAFYINDSPPKTTIKAIREKWAEFPNTPVIVNKMQQYSTADCTNFS